MKTFWVNIILLVFITTLDIFLLEKYMDDWRRETFPMLAYCLREYGLHVSIWFIRAVTYGFILTMMLLPRGKTVNRILTTTNLLYWTAMMDWFFVLKIF